MTGARIREAEIEDVSEFARLLTELGYPSSPAETEGRLRAIFQDPDYCTLVAESSGRLVGLVGLRLGRYYEKSGTFAWIAALVVDEAERGSGVGARLLGEAEAWAASRGATDVLVNSHLRREQAHRFYEGLGYERTGYRFFKVLDPAGVEEPPLDGG